MMATSMTLDEVLQEMTDTINKALAEMPNDETRRAVLDAFSKQMFCDTRVAKVRGEK